MATTTLSDAYATPLDEGIGSVADGDERRNSAAYEAAIAAYQGGAYVHTGLDFSNVDTANDQVDISAGRAYVELSSPGAQSGRGSSSSTTHDITLSAPVPIAIDLVSGITDFQLQSGTNDVYLVLDSDGATTGTAGDVYIAYGTSIAAPSKPSVQLGTVDTTNGTATPLNAGGVNLAQQRMLGRVVALGNANYSIIDPANTTTPVQDAIDFINPDNSGTEGGCVYLPPDTITEDDAVDLARGVSIVGVNDDASQISFPNAGGASPHPGLRVDADLDGSFSRFQDFRLTGPGDNGETGDAIYIDGNMSHGAWDNVSVIQWGGSAIHLDANGFLTSSVFNKFRATICDPGYKSQGLLELGNPGPEARFESLYLAPRDNGSGAGNQRPIRHLAGTATFGAINVGGQPADFYFAAGASATLDSVNYEPGSHDPQGVLVNALGGEDSGDISIRSFSINANSALDVVNVFRLNGKKATYLPKVTYRNGATISGDEVVVDSTSQAAVYAGPTSDVNNNSGGTISPGVTALESLANVT